jgi:UTP--glucose-1-phosphate uridylyltransferase
LPLSLIINPKEVEREKAYQIETAMGAAISVFEDSKAVVVNRDRFAPVKKTNDLLVIWSDAYKLQQNYRLVLDEKLEEPPKVILNERYYKTIKQLEEHCKDGIPSLKKCRKLEISADVFFGKNVEIIGDVKITENGKLENLRI